MSDTAAQTVQKPGVGHVLLALAFQHIIMGGFFVPYGLGLADAHIGAFLASVMGLFFSAGFYISRERRQTEEWKKSNRIPPWVWKPRALRDAGWPILACALASAGWAIGWAPGRLVWSFI